MLIDTLCKIAGIALNADQEVLFGKLVKLFAEKNKQLNLSAIRDEKGIVIKHLIDSLLLTKCMDFSQIHTAIDIGSGGGFPALPLAIYFPNLKVTVNDAIQKKMKAVKEMSEELKITNIETLVGRAEELAHRKDLREQFDVVTLRAVALIPIALEYACGFVKPNKYIVLYKGNTYKEELEAAKNAMKVLSLKLEKVCTFDLPENSGQRAILIYKKTKKLSSIYPREIGTPKKYPL